MNKFKIFLTVFCLSMLSFHGEALADSERMCNEATGHSYKFFYDGKTWNEAEAYCESEGGHLATITSEAENTFVYEVINVEITEYINPWLGGSDANTEGVWEWVTGEAWTYSNWGVGEPNNAYDGQNYLNFWWLHPYTWDDAGLPNDDTPFPFICEWEECEDDDDNLRFDFPVGKPDGNGYNTIFGVPFLWAHEYACGLAPHPGEDWNGNRGGSSDKDDPVWAVANGRIVEAKDFGGEWGKIVLIRHKAPTGKSFSLPFGKTIETVWSQYAHLGEISQNPRTGKEWKYPDKIRRGEQIGTIGESGGQYHLHFEIRKEEMAADDFTCGYYKKGFWEAIEAVLEEYVWPTGFIRANR